MSVLVASELSRETKAILSEDGVCCAVAFWGEGAQDMLTGRDARVICNLSSGGTNPFALRKLASATLRTCDTLHAKVYLGRDRAIISSANVSSNGLGLEGHAQGDWIEAGVLVEDVTEVHAWFETLWSERSRDVGDLDLRLAEAAWRRRQVQRPTVPFSAFTPDRLRPPIIAWAGTEDVQVSKPALLAALGTSAPAIMDLLSDGVVLDLGDDPTLVTNRWILFYPAKRDGLPRRISPPYWVHASSRYVAKGFTCGGDELDGVLASEDQPPMPFDATDRLFRSALEDVLRSPKYKGLIDRDYDRGKPWFRSNDDLMPALWRDLKTRYALPR